MKISLRRLTNLLFRIILTVILVSACNASTVTSITSDNYSVEDCRTVQHVMGSTCIPRNPQRVVTLKVDTLANSLALGVRPIASTHATGFSMPNYLQGKVNQIESVGDIDSPNIERILRLKPDLILSNSYVEGIYDQLSHIAPTVVLNYPWPPLGWKKQLEELAHILNKEDVSEQLMNEYWQRIEQLQKALGDRRYILKISISNVIGKNQFTAYGEKHYSGMILKDIGLQRPESQMGDFFYIGNISPETISDIDGDVLFLLPLEFDGDKTNLENLKQNSLWQQLDVVQRDRVYFVGEHWHEADIFAINAVLDDLFKYLVNTP